MKIYCVILTIYAMLMTAFATPMITNPVGTSLTIIKAEVNKNNAFNKQLAAIAPPSSDFLTAMGH